MRSLCGSAAALRRARPAAQPMAMTAAKPMPYAAAGDPVAPSSASSVPPSSPAAHSSSAARRRASHTGAGPSAMRIIARATGSHNAACTALGRPPSAAVAAVPSTAPASTRAGRMRRLPSRSASAIISASSASSSRSALKAVPPSRRPLYRFYIACPVVLAREKRGKLVLLRQSLPLYDGHPFVHSGPAPEGCGGQTPVDDAAASRRSGMRF